MIKVACYIDGFNMYHSIDDGNRASGNKKNHLKWLSLPMLMREFIDPNVHTIAAVKFFTAYPVWNPSKLARHQAYTTALERAGAEIVVGRFKDKECYCKNCKTTYQGREEKESDVNIAMHLISDGHLGLYDQAFLVTNDSDLLGPVRMVRNAMPKKKIKIIAPPFRKHSKELWAAADMRATISEMHLERCLLPKEIINSDGSILLTRPVDYDPPK